ncbi:MAG: transcription antitermination factor NusB [Planctomycetota bacterium]|jgi:N utilization substance protein B
MRPRSLGRRLAFQYLFMCDLNRNDCEPVQGFAEKHSDIEAARAFACSLVAQYERLVERVDELLQQNSSNYDVARIAAAERSVLRLAITELVIEETPYRVVIDEAINLARKFGSKDSPRFVNGILDAVVKAL